MGLRLPAGPHLPDTSLLLGRHQSQLPGEQLRLEQHSRGNPPLSQFFCRCCLVFYLFQACCATERVRVRRKTLPRCTKRMHLGHKDSEPALILNTWMNKSQSVLVNAKISWWKNENWANWSDLVSVGSSSVLNDTRLLHQTKPRQICRNSLPIALQLRNCTCFAASLTPAPETMLCVSITLFVLWYFNSWKYHFIKNKPSFHPHPCVPALLPSVNQEESDQRELFDSVLSTHFGSNLVMELTWSPYPLIVVSMFSH